LDQASFVSARTEGKAMSKERAIGRAIEQAKTPRDEREDADPPAVREAVVRIFAFGNRRVERDGRPLDSPDWSQKPRELLYFLLSHPEGRTKEQIGLALWPEASTAQLRSSFHDTLYRLRRALGGKEWISFREGR
jgi:two-component SAPR family response regulator